VDTTLLAFAGVSLLLAVTPGPDMAVVTRNALAHGRRGVFMTTTGIALALCIWVAATALGVSALLRASGELAAIGAAISNLEPGDLLLCQVDQIDLALEFVTGLFQQPGARPLSASIAQFAAAAVAVLGIMG
jgi:hypothetical protein